MQYNAGAEGVEFLNSNVSVFYENQYSYSRLKQAQGRNVRRGMTQEIHQYFIVNNNWYDNEIFERAYNQQEIINRTLEEIVNTHTQ